MKRFFTVLFCLSLSCLFLLPACDGAGETAEKMGGPQEESRREEQIGAQGGSEGTNDAHDNAAEEPHYEMLSSLYPWIGSLREKDILGIRTESAAIGVAPGHFREISYSTDRGDIQNVYEEILLSSVKEIPEDEGEITGGGYVQYDLSTKDDTFSLFFSNENVYVNGIYYHFEKKLCHLSSPKQECSAFITYPDMTDRWDTFAVYTGGSEGVKLGEFKGLGAFEFTEYTGECDMNVKLRLVSETVNLRILSENFFMIEDDSVFRVFQITGEKNFSEFFELSAETVQRTETVVS